MRDDFVWTHETARFLIALYLEPEQLDPADCFEFAEDVDAVRSGAVEWFTAIVTVYGPEGEELGSDCLGACAYASVREFITAHRDRDPMNRNCSLMRVARGGRVYICHYFPDMVRNAIADARKHMAARRDVYNDMRH